MEKTAKIFDCRGGLPINALWIKPKGLFFRACLDCLTMAGGLLCAILTTLIIGL